jgi:hypothetical protein
MGWHGVWGNQVLYSAREYQHCTLSACYMYRLLQHQETLQSAHAVYLCIPYGFHNKQRLFI